MHQKAAGTAGVLVENIALLIGGDMHGRCLNRELSEIVVSVKMPITRDGTKRPREPLL